MPTGLKGVFQITLKLLESLRLKLLEDVRNSECLRSKTISKVTETFEEEPLGFRSLVH